MKAIVTVGLGFGDEGKGATVDYLVRQLGAELVVRYSGGAQAGHSVELPDGRRHAFSQFGAGTLAGARTWLGPRMIVSPATLTPEAEHLRSLGVDDPSSLLSAHPAALVATDYHAAMNRLRELARGSDRHGSCGLGIGETRHYWLRYGADAVTVGDLAHRQLLIQKLTLLRDRMLLEMQELPRLDRQWAAALHQTLPAAQADLLQQSMQRVSVSAEMPTAETVVFEGAQGVLLDEWHGFHPYTTWSTVTPLHALELTAEHGIDDVTVLGLTRAYSTRHGAGPFPTWNREFTATLRDAGNQPNAWQGSLRAGPLDLVLLVYAARICRIDALAVTCLDQLPARPRLCPRYADAGRLEIPQSLREQAELTLTLESAAATYRETSVDELLATLEGIAPVIITSTGPTSADRRGRLAVHFDHRRGGR
ncbi:MAG TPA: adenylosuccinate synthetase [Pirellulaceae bacterium]|nr:adenylosuccinate synthetase [Pirellulaceae bacterium]